MAFWTFLQQKRLRVTESQLPLLQVVLFYRRGFPLDLCTKRAIVNEKQISCKIQSLIISGLLSLMWVLRVFYLPSVRSLHNQTRCDSFPRNFPRKICFIFPMQRESGSKTGANILHPTSSRLYTLCLIVMQISTLLFIFLFHRLSFVLARHTDPEECT